MMDITPDFEVNNSILEIDHNGDNIIDKTLEATPDSKTIYDITPPEISISYDIINKEIIFGGIDISPIIVTHSNANTTVKDNQDNTTILNYTKYKEKPTKLKFSFNTITRNGVSTTFPNTHVTYNWKLDKEDNLKDLDTRVIIKGVEKYTFNYRKSNNTTTVKQKIGNTTNITTQPEFVSVIIRTNGNDVEVDY